MVILINLFCCLERVFILMNIWIAEYTERPDKEAFYSKLNLEDITNKDYEHFQKVWEVFRIKKFGEYQDLYVQSNTLLLADVFENFRDKRIEIYTGISMASLPKKDKSKSRIINKY